MTPDRKYYWRARAKNKDGVWGQWGKTWSFTPSVPAIPVDVIMEYDPERSVGTLRWKPNPMGSHPVSFRIYIGREVRELDEHTLSWGSEKIIATIIESIGSANQVFVIHIH